jgi:5-methylcytosine-specific restriction protein A
MPSGTVSPTPRLRGRRGVEQRLRRLRRTHGLCELCHKKGRVEVAVEVDHIIALVNGGEDTDENTQNLCRPCHDEKTRKDLGFKGRRPPTGLDGWPL